MNGQDDTKYDSCKQRRFLRWPTAKSCPPIHPLTHPSTPLSFFMIPLSTLSNTDHMTISSLGQGVSTIKAKRKSLKGQPGKCEQTLLSHFERESPPYPIACQSALSPLAPRRHILVITNHSSSYRASVSQQSKQQHSSTEQSHQHHSSSPLKPLLSCSLPYEHRHRYPFLLISPPSSSVNR